MEMKKIIKLFWKDKLWGCEISLNKLREIRENNPELYFTAAQEFAKEYDEYLANLENI